MSPGRAWVLQPSGKRLDLLHPTPGSWTDRDLAIGLSRTYRWGGHSRWPLPLSVAQHSLLVLALWRRSDGDSTGDARRELLHDAEEGLLAFDPVSPLKPHLGSEFHAVVTRLRAALDARYRLDPWTPKSRARHKRADQLAAASEAVHVTGWSPRDIRETLGIGAAPVAVDPLPPPHGMKPWEPWPPPLAAKLFLDTLRLLSRDDRHIRRDGTAQTRPSTLTATRSDAHVG